MLMATITDVQAKLIAKELKVDLKNIPLAQWKKGLQTELEHKDVTHGNLTMTGRIALAHFKEDPRYYKALTKMEKHLEETKKTKTNKKKSRKNS